MKAFPILLRNKPHLGLRDYALVRINARVKNAIFDIIIAMRVNVLVLDGVFDLGLSAVLDAFQTANELIGISGVLP